MYRCNKEQAFEKGVRIVHLDSITQLYYVVPRTPFHCKSPQIDIPVASVEVVESTIGVVFGHIVVQKSKKSDQIIYKAGTPAVRPRSSSSRPVGFVQAIDTQGFVLDDIGGLLHHL
jgi:hypothetical protein